MFLSSSPPTDLERTPAIHNFGNVDKTFVARDSSGCHDSGADYKTSCTGQSSNRPLQKIQSRVPGNTRVPERYGKTQCGHYNSVTCLESCY